MQQIILDKKTHRNNNWVSHSKKKQIVNNSDYLQMQKEQ